MHPAIRHLREKGQPWNQGILVGQKRPLKLKEVWAARIHLQLAKNGRNLALFNLALGSKLRSCDPARLWLCDLASYGKVVRRASIVQQKNQRPVQSEIAELPRESVQEHVPASRQSDGDYLFPSRQHIGNHLSN